MIKFEPINNIRDMNSYVNEMKSSYSQKRNLYSEFQSVQTERGYSFDKQQYVKEKFPRFPNRLKLLISNMI